MTAPLATPLARAGATYWLGAWSGASAATAGVRAEATA
jgi:hypothetical protein